MNLKEVSRGISHIEDMPVGEIIEILTNLPDFTITEKVDGAQILFGIDETGFYTSRETKGGTRIYNEADYGITFVSTYMRSTHKLLEQMLPVLKGAGLRSGDQVEAEVLYGQVPNVVPYSADTNYLIFLRTTEGTVNIDRLKQKLDSQAVSVSLVSPCTDDGKSITLREQTNNWKFARVPIIEKSYDIALISNHLSEIRRYLSLKDSFTMQPLSVILETPLNKIPDWVPAGAWKTTKEYLKERREEICNELDQAHIFPLKTVLLNNFVRETASAFGPPIEEGGWIEGVVLRSNTTGRMVKIVDKDVFGAIREMAWQKRNMLTERAKGIYEASSFMGRLMLDMATSIGHPELGTMQAKNYLRKAGKITEERVSSLAEGTDFDSVRLYWSSLLEIRHTDLERELDKYEKEEADLSGTGHHRNLVVAIKEKTKQTFAQAFQQINEFQEATLQAKTTGDLIKALAGKQLGEI
jgi:hypothetical protein